MAWKQLPNTRVKNLSERINDIDLVGDRGWAVSSAGNLWRWRSLGAARMTPLAGGHARCVGFARNGTTGWVGFLTTPASDVRLAKTVDGGQNWTEVTALPQHPVAGFCGLRVLDKEHVYACGTFDARNKPGLIKTTDGTLWSSVELPKLSCLTDLHFWDIDHGLLVGGGGSPLRPSIVLTDDGGITWRQARLPARLPADGICWKVYFLDSHNGFVSISQLRHPENGAPALVLKTHDQGETWQTVRVVEDGEKDLQGVGFQTSRQGWAGNRNGETWATKDGGANWAVDPDLTNVNRMVRARSAFFAAGDAVYALARTRARSRTSRASGRALALRARAKPSRRRVALSRG